MISVTHRVLTLTHTMKSFVVLFVVVAVVAANAIPVDKDDTILKKDDPILRKHDTVLKQEVLTSTTTLQNKDGTIVKESRTVKNEGLGEPQPCNRVTVTEHIKEPEKIVPVLKESKA